MTPDTVAAIEAVNLAREINERQERLEVLKATLRAHATANLVDMTGQPHGVWAPALPAPYSGAVLVAVPAPTVALSKEYTPAHVRDRVGGDAYRKYFTEKVTVTLVPVEGFREQVVQEADPDLRDRLLSVVEVVHPTARVSLRRVTPSLRAGREAPPPADLLQAPGLNPDPDPTGG